MNSTNFEFSSTSGGQKKQLDWNFGEYYSIDNPIFMSLKSIADTNCTNIECQIKQKQNLKKDVQNISTDDCITGLWIKNFTDVEPGEIVKISCDVNITSTANTKTKRFESFMLQFYGVKAGE